jgi:hypothetical protein
MKQKKLSRFLLKTTAVLFFGLVVGLGLLLSSFRTQKMTDDIWKMLGITKQTGDENIRTSFMDGYLYYYGARNIKHIALNDRAAVAKDLLNYTKDFIGGPVFKKQYDDMRKNAKPSEPVAKPLRTIDQIQKDEIAKTEKSIKDTEKTMKDLPDLAKSMQPLMDILKKNLKDYQDPKNTYFTSIALGEKNEQEYNQKSYKERLKHWEEMYPVAADQFIATRLQEMLNATKDIDYNAELVEKDNKKKFVKAAYEYKNTEWKQGFRAGKEVTEMARTFAQKWLTELQNKK